MPPRTPAAPRHGLRSGAPPTTSRSCPTTTSTNQGYTKEGFQTLAVLENAWKHYLAVAARQARRDARRRRSTSAFGPAPTGIQKWSIAESGAGARRRVAARPTPSTRTSPTSPTRRTRRAAATSPRRARSRSRRRSALKQLTASSRSTRSRPATRRRDRRQRRDRRDRPVATGRPRRRRAHDSSSVAHVDDEQRLEERLTLDPGTAAEAGKIAPAAALPAPSRAVSSIGRAGAS